MLEHHFDSFMPRVEHAARADRLFGEMVSGCWPFGQSAEHERSQRFGRLVSELRKRA